jgi:hypothetical protein
MVKLVEEGKSLLPLEKVEEGAPSEQYYEADGLFAWITCGLNFIFTYWVFGIMYTNGIILPYMSKDLNASFGTISLAFSMCTSLLFTVELFSHNCVTTFANHINYSLSTITLVRDNWWISY